MESLRFRCFSEPRFLDFFIDRSLAGMMMSWSVSLAITPLCLTRANGPNCQAATSWLIWLLGLCVSGSPYRAAKAANVHRQQQCGVFKFGGQCDIGGLRLYYFDILTGFPCRLGQDIQPFSALLSCNPGNQTHPCLVSIQFVLANFSNSRKSCGLPVSRILSSETNSQFLSNNSSSSITAWERESPFLACQVILPLQ